ncbi:hypothetical protein OS493_034943 [Desmophyllum pertusum]|uniref:Uncharacterized protein n=1 Tax=Desmophyllum pertusum TaxID=174260 RepID=A0A9W9YV41_9CNID|nr:hypothetical protein OS493_034943 [Desmophyllum pertusum]
MWTETGMPTSQELFHVYNEADDGEWSIDEATHWKVGFKEGAILDEINLEENVNSCEKTPEDFIARYDLSYLTPCAHRIRCKRAHYSQTMHPKKKQDVSLSRYLSGLTFTDEDDFGLRLPEKDIPEGFHLIHKRSSKRTKYTINPGFAIIVSKESSWSSEITGEEFWNRPTFIYTAKSGMSYLVAESGSRKS